MNKETPFYTATPEAQLKVNELLALPASGDEYSWEFELADSSKLDAMCQHLESGQLNIEDSSAMALIAIASMEEAVDNSVDVEAYLVRLRAVFNANEELQVRMVSFWIDQGNAEHTEMSLNILLN